MSFLKESEVRAAASSEREKWSRYVAKSSDTVLHEEMAKAIQNRAAFDIFLSHSLRDAEIVLGVKAVLESRGKTVYVDWVIDPDLDRSKVTPATAEKLRRRMRQCGSLIYIYTNNSQASRWMPWELGYFDGHNGNVAVFPVRPDNGVLDFSKEEYLGLYPKVDVTGASIYIHESMTVDSRFKIFNEWRDGTDKVRPAA